MSKDQDLVDRLYAYLQEQWQKNQQMPTQRSMAAACETSLSTINDALSVLHARGLILKQRYKKRGIQLIEGEPEMDEQSKEVYAYIEDAIASGVVPTQTEIATELYLSRREVRRCVTVLETLGYIERFDGNRGYKIGHQNVPHNDTGIEKQMIYHGFCREVSLPDTADSTPQMIGWNR